MIHVPVPFKSYRLYEAAARLIAKKIGKAAPTPADLIQYELSLRDPQLVADDYLDALRRRKKLPPRCSTELASSIPAGTKASRVSTETN